MDWDIYDIEILNSNDNTSGSTTKFNMTWDLYELASINDTSNAGIVKNNDSKEREKNRK